MNHNVHIYFWGRKQKHKENILCTYHLSSNKEFRWSSEADKTIYKKRRFKFFFRFPFFRFQAKHYLIWCYYIVQSVNLSFFFCVSPLLLLWICVPLVQRRNLNRCLSYSCFILFELFWGRDTLQLFSIEGIKSKEFGIKSVYRKVIPPLNPIAINYYYLWIHSNTKMMNSSNRKWFIVDERYHQRCDWFGIVLNIMKKTLVT